MEVTVQHIEDGAAEQENARIAVKQVTPNINKAIELLREDRPQLLVKASDNDNTALVQINLNYMAYVEYLERQMFIYDADNTYSVRMSFATFLTMMPVAFVQISKNTAINVYFITSFTNRANGNILAQMRSGEKLIISRRYVKAAREKLIELTK